MNQDEFSKIETAKLLKSLKSSSIDEATFLDIKSLIIGDGEDGPIDRAILGLSQEDEFNFLCKLMGTTTHLVPLVQTPFIKGEYIVPDFLARFQPGCSISGGYSKSESRGYECLIEVKSTEKDRVKVSGSRLKKLRHFAHQFNFPLLFAVRFMQFEHNAIWVIKEDENPSSSSITIKFDHWLNQIRHVLWDEYWYMLPQDIRFRSICDKSPTAEAGKTTKYGVQTSLIIERDDRHSVLYGSQAMYLSAFFEAFALKEAEVKEIDETKTEILLHPTLHICSMVDMLFRLSNLPIDSEGNTLHDASRAVSHTEDTWFSRELIEKFAKELHENGFLDFIGFTDKETHIDQWRRFGGQVN